MQSVPMTVRADQVQLNDVVVFEPTPGSTEPYLGTVHRLTLLNEDVDIEFYGPQSEQRAIHTKARTEVLVVRMERST